MDSCTDRETGGQTERRRYYVNSWLYCVVVRAAVRSAKNEQVQMIERVNNVRFFVGE